MKRLLAGITPSGDGSLHIGNYLGAVKQFIHLAQDHECFLMVADLHALTTVQDREQLQRNTETLILNELSLLLGELGGLGKSGKLGELGEMENVIFFRQSDVPEHAYLQTILNNVTPLGLIKRAHAYKDKLEKDTSMDEINMGLFNYPILMASDILIYKPDLVPVGKDQKQHIEITRDIAERFNKIYGRDGKTGRREDGKKVNGVFKLPEAYIPEDVAVILGTDGKRKMSKSLGNIISIFEDEEIIRKQVMGTYTDPTRAHATDPGHVEGNMVFAYMDFFGPTSSKLRGASEGKVDELKKAYREGKIADIEVKNYLYECLIKTFTPARKVYQELKANPQRVRQILRDGAEKARGVANETVREVAEAIGLKNSYSITSLTTNNQRTTKSKADSGSMAGMTDDSYVTINDFAKLEMRVGKVVEATNKEGSEKLIRLVVDFGPKDRGDKPHFAEASRGKGNKGVERETRVIFTGVRGFGYTPEFFEEKQFFFITNLAPRKMMDEESQGMILATSNAAGAVDSGQGDDSKPLFLSADGMPVGAKIR